MKATISSYEVGGRVQAEFVVLEAAKKSARNGNYADMVLGDGTGMTIKAKRWQSELVPEVGTVVNVIGDVESFGGSLQINVKRCNPGTLPLSEFLQEGPLGRKTALDMLINLVRAIENKTYSDIVWHILANHGWSEDQTTDELLMGSGAKTVHHNYPGGWAQHTLEVCMLALQQSSLMNSLGKVELERDLILAGALLHDIGKLSTYRIQGAAIEMTDAGNFMEHIVVGTHEVLSAAEALGIQDTTQVQKLVHCVAAHHGQMEWGSPVVPCMIEAFIIHAADLISSKCTMMNEEKKQSTERWTRKSYYFGTRLYNGD